MTIFYDDTVILVFAKAPVAGKVNTRLISDVGIDVATQLQQDLIHHRLAMLRRAKLCAVRLLCAPDIHHECFAQCEQQYPVVLKLQNGCDLGERMFNGVVSALQSYKYCIVIGTDAPALDEGFIKQAIDALHADAEVVFVPAEDGGYVLLGLTSRCEFLFKNISWGSAEVMPQSRKLLQDNNVSFKELETCWDVDTVEDYQRYLRLIGKGQAVNNSGLEAIGVRSN